MDSNKKRAYRVLLARIESGVHLNVEVRAGAKCIGSLFLVLKKAFRVQLLSCLKPINIVLGPAHQPESVNNYDHN